MPTRQAFVELRAKFHQHIRTYRAYPQMRRLMQLWVDQLTQTPTRMELYERHRRQVKTPIQANKELILVRTMFNFGLRMGLWKGENPAKGLTLYPAPGREVLMSREELIRLRDSFPEMAPKYRAYFGLLLLSGCRMSEAREMKWTDLKPGRRWMKPTTKNGHPHVVPLSPRAWEWIQQVPITGEYVFMGLYGHCLSRAQAEKVWGEHRAAIGLTHIWLHDFRRTMMSYLYTVLKADELTVKALLNHYDSRPVAIYTRLNVEYLMQVVEQYEAWLWSL